MNIGVISLVSDVHDQDLISRNSTPFINEFKKIFKMKDIEISEIPKVDIPIVFIKTGGTENKFKKIAILLEKTGKPITLLTSNINNSLPASLEILSWANKKGFRNSILLHGSVEELKEKLEKRIRDIQLIDKLKQTIIGVLGEPSDWLIASRVDYEKVKDRWGVACIDIEIEEVEENIRKFTGSDAEEILSSFPNDQFRKGVTKKDIADAINVYQGIKKTISDHNLSAFTLRCFDLLESLNTTGCIALARLNDEGIPAGCEGDIPALFTMLINKLITGEPSFMANPSQLQNGFITLAHCTVPMSMVDSFGYKTHFESGKGVGIAGKFRDGPITLSKIGGSALDRFYIDKGVSIDNPQSKDLCRTQIKIKPEHGINYFMNDPLGNHHIVTNGNHLKRFKEIMALFDVSPVT